MAASDYAAVTQQLYISYFGRPADTLGAASMQAALNAAGAPTTIAGLNSVYKTNATVKALVDSFGNSAESLALYPGTDAITFVAAIYQNILNRTADIAGLTFWATAIQNGTLTRGAASAAIMAGALANTTAQGVVDAAIVNNKTTVATNFTFNIDTGAEAIAYAGNTAAGLARTMLSTVTNTTDTTAFQATVTSTLVNIVNTGGAAGQTFTLTTGIDTLVGTNANDTFTANATAGPVLTALDNIDGGNGNDTLSVADTAAITVLPSMTVKNIETANLTSGVAVTADVTGWTGLTKLNVVSSSTGAAVDTITAGTTTAVTVVDVAAAAATANLTVTGGSSVTITEANGIANSSAKTITVNGGAGTTSASVTQTTTTANQAQSVTITDTNQAGGTKAGVITTVILDGINTQAATILDSALTSLTVNNSGAATTVTINEGAFATPATTLGLTLSANTALTVNDAGSKYTTLNVTTSTASDLIAGAGFSALTAETIAGSGVLNQTGTNLSGLKTIAISGAAGLTDTTLSGLAALTSVTSTSTGVVTATLNAGQTSFTGGAGRDVITITTAATKAIAGGTATNNELVWNAAAATTFGTVTGFTTLGVSTLSSGTFDMSKLPTFTGIDVVGTLAGPTTFSNVSKNAPLSIGASVAQSINYTAADITGPTDVMTLTLGSATNATALTVADLALFDSTGFGIGTVNLVSNDSVAAGVNTITAFNDGSLGTLTVTGNAGLNIGAFKDSAASLTINGNETGTGGLTFVGITGSGATGLATVGFTGSDVIAVTNLTTVGSTLTVTDSATAAVTIATLVDGSAGTETFTNTGSAVLTVATHTGAGVSTINLNGQVVYTASALTGPTGGYQVNGTTDNQIVTLTGTATAGGKTDNIKLGNGANVLSFIETAGATTNITVGTGANNITVGPQTANITLGTHTSVTGSDTINVGLNGSVTIMTTITGAVAGDKIGIASATAQPLIKVTAAMVTADVTNAAGDPTLFTSYVTTALDAAAAGGAGLAQFQVAWFNFQGNTYFVEQGAATGTFSVGAADTIVKLVGIYDETSIGAVAAGKITLV